MTISTIAPSDKTLLERCNNFCLHVGNYANMKADLKCLVYALQHLRRQFAKPVEGSVQSETGLRPAKAEWNNRRGEVFSKPGGKFGIVAVA